MGKGCASRTRAAVVTATVALSLGVSLPAFSRSNKSSNKVQTVPGEIIVRLKDSGPGTQSTVFSSLGQAFGENSVLSVKPFQTDKKMFVVRMAKDGIVSAAITKLKSESKVEIAEPNYVMRAFDLPNDTDFAKLWGIKNTGQADSSGQTGTPNSDVNVVPLWEQGFKGSRNVLVAVIDTGIDFTHPDLKDNMFVNAGEVAGNGKDDDGNGFVDDVNGWNFAANSNASKDDHGHGSHCAGTIGGVGNNGMGVVGVNWEVSLLPVKFLDASGGGSLQGAIESINYARLMKANIMSNSWGGGGYSEALKKAIEDARDAGIIFVAAAGNESNNNDSSPTYPAAYDVANVIAVAATDNRDTIAGFSNFGTRTVHVAAPGVKVYSTVKDGGYDTYSGTSMACPHVAGVSALLLAANPTWTVAEIKDRLIKTSDKVPALRKKVMAKGRVNAYNAMHGIVPPSDEPEESAWLDFAATAESTHPYKDKMNETFVINVPGAKMVRVVFEKVDVEARYDHVTVEGASGVADDISGSVTNYVSEYLSGDSVTIRLKSDGSVTGWGFKVAKVQFIPQ